MAIQKLAQRLHVERFEQEAVCRGICASIRIRSGITSPAARVSSAAVPLFAAWTV
jgi:hypothetical protein